MFPFQKKQQTILDRLNSLVDEGKQQLRKDLVKEIKSHLDEVVQAAHKALTTKHKGDLDKAREEIKSLKAQNKELSSQLQAAKKLVAKVNQLTAG